MKLPTAFIVLYGILISIPILSNPTDSKNTSLRLDRYNTNDGLPNNQVTSIFQDSHGYLWIGTDDGIAKFNGYNFEITRKSNTVNSISDNFFKAIIEDEKGDIWAGTYGGGLNHYYRKEDRWESTILNEDKDIQPRITTLFFDPKGNLWIGTMGDGLFLINKHGEVVSKKFSHSSIENWGIDYISSFAYRNNTVLVGTYFGIIEFELENETITELKPRLNNTIKNTTGLEIKFLYQYNDSILYFGTPDNGIYSYNFNTLSLKIENRINKFLKTEEYFSDLKIDMTKNFWISKYHGGLILLDSNLNLSKSLIYKENDINGIAGDAIYSILIDKSKNIWLATSNGLNFINRSVFSQGHFYKEEYYKNSLNSNDIRCFEQVGNEIIIGTWGNGINILNTETNNFNYLKIPAVKEHVNHANQIFDILVDSDKDIWVGTNGNGLYLFDGKFNLKKHYNPSDSISVISAEIVPAITETSDKFIWIGTWGNGLLKYDKKIKTLRYFDSSNDKNTISSEIIFCLLEDSRNRLWVSIWGKGLYFYEKTFDRLININAELDKDDQIESNFIHTITEDENGKLYIGTSGEGLYILDLKNLDINSKNNKIIKITEANGLSNNLIQSIISEGNGIIWVSTNNGLSKINTSTNSIINYYQQDGLQNNQFNRDAGFIDCNGTIYFGGINGFNKFNSELIENEDSQPFLTLKDLYLNNKIIKPNLSHENRIILIKTLEYTDLITLSYKDFQFGFDFELINISNSSKFKFQYKLKNFDLNWIEINKPNIITYNNITPGEYEFQILCFDQTNKIIAKSSSLKIIIKPPVWQTIWFKIALTVLIIGLIVFSFYWRIEFERKRNLQLKQKVKERTKKINKQRKELEIRNNVIEKSYQNIRLISEFGQKLNTVLNFNELSIMLYEYLSNMLDTWAFGIGIYNSKTTSIVYKIFKEDGKDLPAFVNILNEKNTFSAWCFKEKEIILINNLTTEYKNYLTEFPTLKTSRKPVSVIYLPLFSDFRPIGILTVQSLKQNAYSEQDILILKTLASYIAIAIDNINAYEIVKQNNNQIHSSICYAKTIQDALLPQKQLINNFISSYIVFQPKEIVSGDFYYFKQKTNTAYIGVVDCTGHGVHGAFMSILGIRILNEVLDSNYGKKPSEILTIMNEKVISEFSQRDTDNDDSMEISLLFINKEDKNKIKVIFSGAKSPILIYDNQNKQIKNIPGVRRSIGGYQNNTISNLHFKDHDISIAYNDSIYLYTDGIINLCNEKRVKFGTDRFFKLITDIQNIPLTLRDNAMRSYIRDFSATEEQRDDITILCLNFNN